jgi:6-phosphofructokinase
MKFVLRYWGTCNGAVNATPRDRWLATRFGSMAIQLIARQEWGMMVALQGTNMVAVPIGQANKSNFIDPNGEMVHMARDFRN